MEGLDGRNPLVSTNRAARRGCVTVTSSKTDRFGKASCASWTPNSVLTVLDWEEDGKVGQGRKHGPRLRSPQGDVVVLAAVTAMGQYQ